MKLLLSCLLCILILGSTSGYTVDKVYSGTGIYDPGQWNFFTGGDPTHGSVEYQSYSSAMSNGLLSSTTLGTNYYSTKIKSSPGAWGSRKSVRLESKATWNRGLFVMEFSHMPSGCSTWPAWWLLSATGPWPAGGEIDIVEGVNNNNENAATLHTLQGCQQDANAGWGYGNGFTGKWAPGADGTPATNCWINEPTQYGNQGCGINANNQNSFGQGFNNGGGGTYALEVTNDFIRVFFFKKGSYAWQSNPNPNTWGTPTAYFKLGPNCPASFFYNLKIIINLTFCGDWAGGSVFSQMCGGDCKTYVENHKAELNANAYWDINSITVYRP